MEIPIFDLNSLTTNFSLMMFGMQGTGKSHAIKNIIHTLLTNKVIDEFVIISSEKIDLYSSFANIVYLKYTEEITKQFLLKQKEDKTKHRLIIFDCCLGEPPLGAEDWLKDRYLIEILYNSKFYNISYILAMRNHMSFSKELRDKFDYIFMFAENIASNQLKLYDQYVTNNTISFKTFRTRISGSLSDCTITNETNNFNILILHNKTQDFFTFVSSEIHFDKSISIMLLNLEDGNACISDDNNKYDHTLKKHKGFFNDEFFMKSITNPIINLDDEDENIKSIINYVTNSDDEEIISVQNSKIKFELTIDHNEILSEILECNEIILKKIIDPSNSNILIKLAKCNKKIVNLIN